MSIIKMLNERFPIRRSKAQKAEFRAWFIQQAQELGYAAQEEENGEHHNVVIGDPEKAKAVFTAHYDTPAAFFLPNLMTPRNRVFFWVYQLSLVCCLLLLSLLAGIPTAIITGNKQLGYMAWYVVYMGILLVMLYGPANKHNVNDNTSGVAAILECMGRIPREHREKVAFILFDNEEKGCRGSRAYAKKHPQVRDSGFIINLDCVGDGEHILLLTGPKARELPQYAALSDAMNAREGRCLHLFPLEKSVFNSDQKNFKVSSAVCACKEKRLIGYYCDRIHTKRDTVCEQANLDFLAEGLSDFAARL